MSTRVGGVPEVLPPQYITLADPTPRGTVFIYLLLVIEKWFDCSQRAMVPIRSRQRMQGVIHNMIFDLSSLCLTFIPSTSTDFAPSLSLHLFTKCSLQNEYNRSILSPISALFFALCESIDRREKGELPDPVEKHKEIQKMWVSVQIYRILQYPSLRYVWSDVASRTQIVYESAMKEPRIKWSEGLRRYWCGYCRLIFDLAIPGMSRQDRDSD